MLEDTSSLDGAQMISTTKYGCKILLWCKKVHDFIQWNYMNCHTTKLKIWPVHPANSDQHGHPPSLIRVFVVHMKKPWVLNYPLSTQRWHWSDWQPGHLAQLGASLMANQGVAGSSPSPSTFFRWDLVMKISTTILTLPLIQEGQLSVTGERMGTKFW